MESEYIGLGGGSFRNDMCSFHTKDDVLTLLIHLGYFGHEPTTGEAFIPNKEIIMEFENAMNTGKEQNDCILRGYLYNIIKEKRKRDGKPDGI